MAFKELAKDIAGDKWNFGNFKGPIYRALLELG